MNDVPRVTVQEKVEFLLEPGAYPDRPSSVLTVETHFAWVFLADRFVYKLKKPTRFQQVDFTSLRSRKANCELEILLNRRLAESVYIAVVPLTIMDSTMRLEGNGTPIEWLVKMHRLPSTQMLDEAARRGTVRTADLDRLVAKLSAFYHTSDRAPWDGAGYLERLVEELREYGERLIKPDLRLNRVQVERLTAAQQRFVETQASQLEARAAAGWVVDAHGDLRPEHVCLVDPPQIIDCLEFNRELRLLDCAADITFLALECERLGYGALGRQLLPLYREHSSDPITPELLAFYHSRRALIRAHLSAWHLIDDAGREDSERWIRRAEWYLEAGQASIDRALA